MFCVLMSRGKKDRKGYMNFKQVYWGYLSVKLNDPTTAVHFLREK